MKIRKLLQSSKPLPRLHRPWAGPKAEPSPVIPLEGGAKWTEKSFPVCGLCSLLDMLIFIMKYICSCNLSYNIWYNIIEESLCNYFTPPKKENSSTLLIKKSGLRVCARDTDFKYSLSSNPTSRSRNNNGLYNLVAVWFTASLPLLHLT